MMKTVKKVMIMAGGTGGHIMPGLALAKHFQNQGIEIAWLGTEQGIEKKLVAGKEIRFFSIDIQGVRGKGIFRKLMMPWILLKSIFQARRQIKRFQPDFILGMGGYVAAPGGIASWLANIPLYIHEQNQIAGLTNKLLSKLAKHIFQSFPNTFPASYKVITSGNPIRQEIAGIPSPEIRYQTREDKTVLHILVLGGSLGAQVLNEIVPQALIRLQQHRSILVKHQTGIKSQQTVNSIYQQENINAEVENFIDNIAQAYTWADIVISRAGASTVAEIAAAGVSSVLIPYPYAVDDHQTANAVYLANQEAAKIIQQKVLTADRLLQCLLTISQDRQYLLRMAQQARAQAQLSAVQTIAKFCLGERSA